MLRDLALVSRSSWCVGATLSCESSLLLEHLLSVLLSELHSVVFAFALELITMVSTTQIKSILDSLFSMIDMLFLFLVSLSSLATA